MLILILINVQYLEKAVFSFDIGSTGQKYSSSGYHHPIKKFPAPKFLISPTTSPLNAIWKTLGSEKYEKEGWPYTGGCL